MIVLAAIGPALLLAILALSIRQRLRALGFLAWIGWTLLGAGIPVLAGQLAALAIVSDAPDGLVGPGAADQIRLALAGGLSGGFGWAAGALSARFSGSGRSD